MASPKHRMQKTALGITRWIGSPQSIFIHTLLFVIAVFILVKGIFTFDVVILVFNTAISLEAIYLALFIQMTVNYTTATIEEVEQDIDEIQEDMGEIQEDIDEIQEDFEEMSEEEALEEERKMSQKARLEQIHDGLQKLMQDIERLQNTKQQ